MIYYHSPFPIGADDRSTSTDENTDYLCNGASSSDPPEITQSYDGVLHENIDTISNVPQEIVVDDTSKLNEEITDEPQNNKNISSNFFGRGAISKKKKSKKDSTQIQKDNILTIEHGNDEPDDGIGKK